VTGWAEQRLTELADGGVVAGQDGRLWLRDVKPRGAADILAAVTKLGAVGSCHLPDGLVVLLNGETLMVWNSKICKLLMQLSFDHSLGRMRNVRYLNNVLFFGYNENELWFRLENLAYDGTDAGERIGRLSILQFPV
jgi:hypothetical protein